MARYNNPRKTWRYGDEFKSRAVELSYQEGIQVQQAAEGLGFHPFMLSRWRKEYREGRIRSKHKKRVTVMQQAKGPTPAELKKLTRLESDNEPLRKENDLLKKWQRYLAEQHQSALDSSRSTDKRLASDTCASGWACPGAATMRGSNALSAPEPGKTSACSPGSRTSTGQARDATAAQGCTRHSDARESGSGGSEWNG